MARVAHPPRLPFLPCSGLFASSYSAHGAAAIAVAAVVYLLGAWCRRLLRLSQQVRARLRAAADRLRLLSPMCT